MWLPTVADLTLIVTVTLPFLAWLARKRIGRYLFRTFIEFARDDFFDEVSTTTGAGEKRVLLRPNAKLGAFLSSVVPGLVDWARQNVTLKLPPFQLPEGVDLKAIGTSVLAQKALSGKKLKLDDAVPMLLGYAKDWAEQSGILDTLGKGLGGTAVKKKAVEESTETVGRITR